MDLQDFNIISLEHAKNLNNTIIKEITINDCHDSVRVRMSDHHNYAQRVAMLQSHHHIIINALLHSLILILLVNFIT